MNVKEVLSVSKRSAGFGYAGRGFLVFLRQEAHAWIHLAATLVVVLGLISLPMEAWETVACLICIGMVWLAEMLNSCLEKLLDLLHPGKDERVRNIKDMAAAAVLVVAIISLITGLYIFIPKFISL